MVSGSAVTIARMSLVSSAALPTRAVPTWRRMAASDLFDAGVDVGVVRRILGHANVATTLHDDRRGEETKRRAALLHVPIAP